MQFQRSWFGMFVAAALLTAFAVPSGAAPEEQLFVVVSPLAEAGPSGVVIFEVDQDGALFQGSTYATGGEGRGSASPQTAVVDPSKRILFVPNNASADISAFTIDEDGSLSAHPGSPFASGETPSDMALHPTGDWLYVTNFSIGSVTVHDVSASGSLTLVQTIGAGFPLRMEVHPSGEYVYVADLSVGVRGFAVAMDGTLSELAGSPFMYTSGRSADVEIGAAGERLYVLDLDQGIAMFDIESNGELVPVVDPPVFVSGFTGAFLLTDDNAHIYANEGFVDLIHGFRVRGTGRPRQVNRSPFPGDLTIIQMLDRPGTRTMYTVARDLRRIGMFELASNGRLSAPEFFAVEDPDQRVPLGAAFFVGNQAR